MKILFTYGNAANHFQIKIFQLDIINIHTKIIWNKDTIQKILSDDT
jgi:hypothetical protein